MKVFLVGAGISGLTLAAALAQLAGSALRRQLIDDAPHFLGLSAIAGDAALASEDPLLGGGYFMTLGDHGD